MVLKNNIFSLPPNMAFELSTLKGIGWNKGCCGIHQFLKAFCCHSLKIKQFPVLTGGDNDDNNNDDNDNKKLCKEEPPPNEL